MLTMIAGPAVAHDRAHAPAKAASEAPVDKGGDVLPIAFGGPFSLIDHTGAPRSDRDFRGRYVLMFFGYTSCPYTCSTVLLNVAGTLDELGAAGAELSPVFVSVDPEHDTPERLAKYLGAIDPRLIGLTGDPAEVSALARAYHVSAVPAEDPGRFERLVNHSSFSYLMGPDGKFLTLLPPVLPAEKMAAILRGYLD
jgi:protein SCO1/2